MVDWYPIKRWLFTTNHKNIGILYLLTALYFIVVAGVLALTDRIQIIAPDTSFLTAAAYNQAITMHGLLMLLWVITPLGAAFANYIIPLQIGAKDMGFPRLNALSYWLYLASGILMLFSFFAPGGTADWGWTTYAPLNTLQYSPAAGASLVGLAILLLLSSSIVATINFLVTIFRLRAPGMKLMRLPLFTWGWLYTVIIMLWAFPSFISPLVMLITDRVMGTVFYSSNEGGALLWDHLFWFFGHPEVYVLLLPGLTIAGDMFAVFSGRSLYMKRVIVAALGVAVGLSYVVWIHHMFMTGIDTGLREFFNITTELISIPFGVIVLAFILTLMGGRIRFTTPMLFAIGTIMLFTIGGATGVFNASIPLNYGLRGTFWVVGHFHYTIVGGGLTGLMAGLYYWFPKMTGKMYSERLGKLHFAIYIIGFNILYFPMYLLYDMPRRIFSYGPETGWGQLNLLTTIGGFLFGVGFLVLFVNLIYSLVRGKTAGPDPWGAPSLEWKVSSPPPEYNFEKGTPVITDEGVRFSEALTDNGSNTERNSEHLSPWPLIVSVGAGMTLLGLIFGLPLLIAGLLVFSASLIGWGWEDITEKFRVEIGTIGEKWPFEAIDNFSLGTWFFVFGEIALFGSLFGGYIFLRANSAFTGFDWPLPGQIHNISFGAFNTIILLTSGLAIALAFLSIKQNNLKGLKGGLIATFLLGTFFLVNKGFEWIELFSEGITFSTDIVSSSYFVLTGVHAAHVIAGLIGLIYLIIKAFKGGFTSEKNYGAKIFVIYWGMVDAVWMIIFPVFYLL